ncbi:Bifunctional protein HldE [bacterium HR19]|nr:Bifunctional protein HldE [bacterium HR19]
MRFPEEKILSLDKLDSVVQNIRSEKKSIAFTNGCFDIIHAGHIKTFFEAKKYADILFVGINSDQSVRRLKGEKRPILPLEMRMIVVASVEAVDYVIPFDDDTPLSLIEKIEPDVLVKGEDWEEDKIVGADIVKSRGGKIVRVKLIKGLSTTNIIARIIEKMKD